MHDCHHHHHHYHGSGYNEDCSWSESDSTILAWILLVAGILVLIGAIAG